MPNQVHSGAIRAELARAGFEQKDVAAWLDYHPSQVTKRMRGEVDWRVSELRTIAERLGVPVSALVDSPAEPETAATA